MKPVICSDPNCGLAITDGQGFFAQRSDAGSWTAQHADHGGQGQLWFMTPDRAQVLVG